MAFVILFEPLVDAVGIDIEISLARLESDREVTLYYLRARSVSAVKYISLVSLTISTGFAIHVSLIKSESARFASLSLDTYLIRSIAASKMQHSNGWTHLAFDYSVFIQVLAKQFLHKFEDVSLILIHCGDVGRLKQKSRLIQHKFGTRQGRLNPSSDLRFHVYTNISLIIFSTFLMFSCTYGRMILQYTPMAIRTGYHPVEPVPASPVRR